MVDCRGGHATLEGYDQAAAAARCEVPVNAFWQDVLSAHGPRADDDRGRRRRRGSGRAARTRRRRVRASIIGAVIGWGLAGLDGGFAGTTDMPPPRIDFAAAGTEISAERGRVAFDLARRGAHVREVQIAEDGRVEQMFDRAAAHVTIIEDGKVSVEPSGARASMLDPFSRAEEIADAPLHIERDGVGRYLGIPCTRFRATGTADGKPLHATACITAEGIPLVAAIFSARLRVSTKITEIDFNPPDVESFLIPSDDPLDEPRSG
jgi:hypothetical protein